MPKDATKNVDRYKIRGGQLNEFDFHQNQEEFSEQQNTRAANLIPGTPPEARAERLRPVAAKARKPAKKSAAKSTKSAAKSTKKAAKSTKKAAKASPRGATAKKLAARKAAKKK